MFAFGTNAFGDNRCWRDGCKCLCETAAHNDGTCDISEHMGYNLYRFTSWESGKNHFSYNSNLGKNYKMLFDSCIHYF